MIVEEQRGRENRTGMQAATERALVCRAIEPHSVTSAFADFLIRNSLRDTSHRGLVSILLEQALK